jgi:hypothetical protein
MAMTRCRECGGDVSTEAESCPHCGIANPGRAKAVRPRGRRWLAVAAVGGAAVVAWLAWQGGVPGVSSAASCEIDGRNLNPSVFPVDGELDAGYEAHMTVSNRGQRGEIVALVALSTSEGTFRRSQTLLFGPGESRRLTFKFHEPTINVTNVQAQYSCRP